jgi:hypothetical protein
MQGQGVSGMIYIYDNSDEDFQDLIFVDIPDQFAKDAELLPMLIEEKTFLLGKAEKIEWLKEKEVVYALSHLHWKLFKLFHYIRYDQVVVSSKAACFSSDFLRELSFGMGTEKRSLIEEYLRNRQ